MVKQGLQEINRVKGIDSHCLLYLQSSQVFERPHQSPSRIENQEANVNVSELVSDGLVVAVPRQSCQIRSDIPCLDVLAVLLGLGLDRSKLLLHLGLVPSDDANVKSLVGEISAELLAYAI